jgi:hypothetical protein
MLLNLYNRENSRKGSEISGESKLCGQPQTKRGGDDGMKSHFGVKELCGSMTFLILLHFTT